ncbi:MAG: hypothetical protein JNK66_14045 [Chitinophagales bacterium]|nr:hypothetical protein [Chitinophagales bacterium]
MYKTLIAVSVMLLLYSCSKDETTYNPAAKGKSGSVTRFAAHNGYLYVLDQNKIKTYMATGSGEPTLQSTVYTDYGLETITIYDAVIYLGSRDGLYILDISNPSLPKVLSKTERSTLFGRCDPVVVQGNYAYSTVKTTENSCGSISAISALITYDVSNKNNPVQIDAVALNQPNGLGIAGNHLFVCDDGDDMIHVFDITSTTPVNYTTITVTDPRDVICTDGKMIVSTANGFWFYNISNISDIKLIGNIAQ